MTMRIFVNGIYTRTLSGEMTEKDLQAYIWKEYPGCAATYGEDCVYVSESKVNEYRVVDGDYQYNKVATESEMRLLLDGLFRGRSYTRSVEGDDEILLTMAAEPDETQYEEAVLRDP